MIITWITFQAWLVLCLSKIIEVSSIEEIITKPISLIYFYANDCQFCQAFSEDFEYLSLLYNSSPNFQVARIDGRKNKELKDLFGVKHYPSLKLYDHVKKSVSTFTETRSVENLQNFLKKYAVVDPDYTNARSGIAKVCTIDDIKLFQEKDKAVLLALVEQQDEDWATYIYPHHFYNSLSSNFPDITFTVTFIDDVGYGLMEAFYVGNVPALVLVEGSHIGIYNSLTPNTAKNKIDTEDIKNFLNEYMTRKIGTWFEDVESLAAYAENTLSFAPVQRKSGMNYVESSVSDTFIGLELEDQYIILVDKISL